MRISTVQIYRQATDSLMRTLSDMYELNGQISSGKRINKPSDDPTGTSRAMAYKVSIAAGEQYLSNIDGATTAITSAEAALSSANTAYTRLKQLTVQGATDGTSDASRAAIAEEIGQLRDQLLSLANTKVGSSYVFSGFQTDTPAFDASSYAYQGDAGSIKVGIGSGVLLPQNVTGDAAFQYDLPAAGKVVEIESGIYAHYAKSGATITVEIRDSATAGAGNLIGSETFDNAIQMTDALYTAMKGSDMRMISALMLSVDDMAEHANNVRADLGARLNRLEDQGTRLEDQNLLTKTNLSSVEDADIVSAAGDLAKANTVLSAVQASTAKILSQSLLDFLN